ncbi:hypothetical protein RHMOL_Rhmol04G0364200 [Rhododendron molle]|uniref:Uncharacterized protein n=1 Tax=Rhododendron molle TaxID=49168 RepID=A0ACC0P7S2_RHOML|nr:hypothetical protein RHMOL_Rhmol04G0364200 [Rhododendron molle]
MPVDGGKALMPHSMQAVATGTLYTRESLFLVLTDEISSPLVRFRSDLFSEYQRIQYTIETQTQAIPYARTYLLTLKEIVREIPSVQLIVSDRRRKLNFLSEMRAIVGALPIEKIFLLY